MARMSHPVLIWVANLLVPGAGLVLIGRLVTGIILAVFWTAAVAGLLLAAAIWPDSATPRVAVLFVASATALYLGTQIILFLYHRAGMRHARSEARSTRFKEALVAYLQGHLDESEAICKGLLRQDPDDVEATIQLAAIARQRGQADVARRHLVRARYLDDEGRWDFEISRRLAALAEGGGGGGPRPR